MLLIFQFCNIMDTLGDSRLSFLGFYAILDCLVILSLPLTPWQQWLGAHQEAWGPCIQGWVVSSRDGSSQAPTYQFSLRALRTEVYCCLGWGFGIPVLPPLMPCLTHVGTSLSVSSRWNFQYPRRGCPATTAAFVPPRLWSWPVLIGHLLPLPQSPVFWWTL